MAHVRSRYRTRTLVRSGALRFDHALGRDGAEESAHGHGAEDDLLIMRLGEHRNRQSDECTCTRADRKKPSVGLGVIERAHEEDLYTQVGAHDDASTNDKVTRAQTATGLAEHDVYHLGQIALLKKALRAKS